MNILENPATTAFAVAPDDAGRRLDQYLARQLLETSRVRVQQLISQGKVLVDGKAPKASLLLHGGEQIEVIGEGERSALRAIAAQIPLDLIYHDHDLSV